jgi:sugar phosphate isomerase/epimerase
MNTRDLHYKNPVNNGISRRKFLGSTAAIAALSIVPIGSFSANSMISGIDKRSDPDSNFGGVQIGAISYSWRSMPGGTDNIINYCLEAGISSLELMSGDVESDLGAPKAKDSEELKKWRLSVPMSRFTEVGKKFNNAGIKIHIVKFSPEKWSDEEIDYAFRAAKAMGAKGVTNEIGEEAVKRLAPFAAKHGMYAIFHNHLQFAKSGFSYDPFLAESPAVMMNFDAGHFFGSTGIHPNTIIEKYHNRIFSIHMKDKTGPNADPKNTNQVWGQGEAPIADILLLLKSKKWPIYVDIELEYEVKPWSNAVKETKTCVQYARQILI